MLITGSTGSWGNATDQLTFSTPLFGRVARIVLGASDYDADVERAEASFVPPVDPSVVVLAPGSTRIRFSKAAVELPYAASSGVAAGVELTTQSLESAGAATGAHLGHAAPPSPRSATVLSAWGSTRAALSERLDVEVGVRLDGGTRPAGSTSLRASPHIALRHETTQRLFLSLAGRRSYQYLRRVGPAGTPFGSGHTFGHAWALSGPTVPALRTELVSAGVERNLAYGWWLSGTAWLRHATGVPSLDPTPGARATTRVEWMAGVNRAKGVEVQLRRIAGPVAGHVSYGWLTSTTRVAEVRFDATAERPHMLDVLASWQARPTLRMGLSLSARSGTPYTRSLPDPCLDDLRRTDDCTATPLTTFGDANALRTPGSASMDFSLDWVRRHRTWGWGLTAQLFNVFGLDQTGAYSKTECPPNLAGADCVRSSFAIDRFYSGLGFPLPMLTFRAWF